VGAEVRYSRGPKLWCRNNGHIESARICGVHLSWEVQGQVLLTPRTGIRRPGQRLPPRASLKRGRPPSRQVVSSALALAMPRAAAQSLAAINSNVRIGLAQPHQPHLVPLSLIHEFIKGIAQAIRLGFVH